VTDLSEFQKKPDTSVKASVTVTSDGGELETGELRKPLELTTDWNEVLQGFGLDPDVFYVVNDTVKMSKWQTSKRTDDGDRDVLWLYSYKARFARRSPGFTEPDLDRVQSKVDKWRPKNTATKDEVGSTFVICWADWQLGKSENGGVEATVERIQSSFQASRDRIRELRKSGRKIKRVAVLNMGDPSEGCDGNYASQRFTVQLTQRAQLNLILDLWVQGLLAIEADEFVSVLCNHGEWTRNGGSKPITSDSDNVGGYLGDTVERIFANSEHGPSKFSVAHDEFVQLIDFSGVPVAVTHGHKISGKEFEWLRGQSQRLQFDTGIMPRLWITAHRHHVSVEDFGPFWRIQCPSNDGGSKWFTDMTGKWSTPGTMTMLVGDHDSRGFSDLAIV
jgi:hypothetical protein